MLGFHVERVRSLGPLVQQNGTNEYQGYCRAPVCIQVHVRVPLVEILTVETTSTGDSVSVSVPACLQKPLHSNLITLSPTLRRSYLIL